MCCPRTCGRRRCSPGPRSARSATVSTVTCWGRTRRGRGGRHPARPWRRPPNPVPWTGALAGIFTQDATYRQSPYEEPITGLPAIAAMWEAERDGPDEVFHMTSDVIAADGDAAVIRVEVGYGDPVHQDYRDLWVL